MDPLIIQRLATGSTQKKIGTLFTAGTPRLAVTSGVGIPLFFLYPSRDGSAFPCGNAETRHASPVNMIARENE